MKLSSEIETGQRRRPLAPSHERTEWEKRACKALDSWSYRGSEESVAEAIEKGFRDGIKRAAAFVEEQGQPQLGIALRRLAEEKLGES